MDVQTDESTTAADTSLIVGRNMRCPRCEELHDILRYVPMGLQEKYARETTMVYKCPSCKWIFAPIDDIVLAILTERAAARDRLKVAPA